MLDLNSRGQGQVSKLEKLSKHLGEVEPQAATSFNTAEEVTPEQDHALHITEHASQRASRMQKWLRTGKAADLAAFQEAEAHLEAHRALVSQRDLDCKI